MNSNPETRRPETRVLRECGSATGPDRRLAAGSKLEPVDFEKLVDGIVKESEPPQPEFRTDGQEESNRRPTTIHQPARGRRPTPDRRSRPANFWITKPILRARGWTDTAVRDFLPRPERHCDNPHPEGGRRPMPLWRAETIAVAESTTEWQTWLEKSLHRRRKTLDDLTAAIKDPAFRRRAKAADTAITAHQIRRRRRDSEQAGGPEPQTGAIPAPRRRSRPRSNYSESL